MNRNLITTILLTLGVYLLLQNTSRLCAGSAAARPYPRNPHHLPKALELKSTAKNSTVDEGAPSDGTVNLLTVPMFGVSFQDEEDGIEKRQFNDYGHMRFGKRSGGEEKFDDYGYMRFGRGFV